MIRTSASLFALGLLVTPCPGGAAHAQEPAGPDARSGGAQDVTRFLASTQSAAVEPSAAVTAAWGGYDGAARAPVFSVGTEVRVVRRVSLIAGVAYGSTSASSIGLRPQLGMRVQLLEQSAAGVDASATVMFRQDRFTAEDGLFQGSLAVGRTFGETSTVLNVVYAQDGEGDDHEGELRMAAVRRIHGGLHVGIEGRYMHAIASTDPHRAALGTPSMEAKAGPLIAYLLGSWAFFAEVGVCSRETSHLDNGVTTLGGIATTF